MFEKYCKWLDDQVVKHYGVHLVPEGELKTLIDRLVPRFTQYDLTEAVIIILKVDGKTAGMARLNKFSDKIGMIHNVYIYPEYRGNGYSKSLMSSLEDKAREFGYDFLRLDTGGFNLVAQNMYKKLGYIEIERFTPKAGLENEKTQKYYDEKIHMEKKL